MKMEKLRACNLCESNELLLVDKNNNICQCKNCGFVFDNPRPTWEEIVSYYSRNDKYDSWLGELEERDLLWKRRLRLVKKYMKSGDLLDVGTGIGQFLFYARNDFKVRGTEISESAIAIAKEKYDMDVIKGEIEHINLDYNFNVITLFHVLEHVSNPSSTIMRCRELLKNGGILIIAVPNDIVKFRLTVKRFLSIFKGSKPINFCKLGLTKLTLDGSQYEIHLSHFTPSVLQGFLERNGFVISKITLDPYYVARGIKKVYHDLLYFSCLIVMKILRINLYFTTWIVAKNIK